MTKIPTRVRAMHARKNRGNDILVEETSDTKWKTELLDFLLQLSPASFERLCGRLLREAGFISVRIIGSSFTAEAKHEATREGTPPIDLIDGERICELLKEYGLGVTTRTIEEVSIVRDFFTAI